MMKKHMPVKWLVTIVDRGKGSQVAEIYRQNHVDVQLIALGKGTASSEIMDYLGLDEPEKDLVLSLAPGPLATGILSQLNETLHFSRPGKGIAFSIPLSGISVGMAQRVVRPEEETAEEEKEAPSAMERQTHDLIVAVVENGQSDLVMKAARAAGAKGGTVAKVRETGTGETHRIFGIPIQPEKELVLIVVPAAEKQAVMQGICAGVREETGERVMAFSIPVDGVTGIDSF